MDPALFHHWLTDPARRPIVVGVLNLTPDSFSDGGVYSDASAAIAHARRMVDDGAGWIDCGAESTRPGSLPVPEDEQISRLEPVLRAIIADPAVTGRAILSVDTTRAAVAQRAIALGAHVINDISAGRDDPDMFPLIARKKVPTVLMHMLGRPRDMQDDPRYDDVTDEVISFLSERSAAAEAAGIHRDLILIDPGIGFGKTARHNLELLNRLDEIVALGRPVLVGTSRKRFIGQITGVSEPAERIMGTAATVAWSIARGAAAVRVHDVQAMSQVVRMTLAMMDPSRQ